MPANRRASIVSTRVHTLRSHSINQMYTVSVAMPASYSSKPSKLYPTIYLLDANFHFGMVTDMTRSMALDDGFPETLVVGLGYPSRGSLKSASNRVLLLRSRDLTPIPDPSAAKMLANRLKIKRVATGGAQSMLSFLSDQTIPFIERTYRSNPTRRVLVGHSFGGLFALYALFSSHRLFKGYVAANPSLWYSDGVVFRYEAEYATHHKRLPVKLFLAAGEREEDPKYQMTSNVIRLAGRLRNRRYRGLALTSLIVPECAHCASTAPAYQAGLHAILGH
jgi:predicted alpha/beta superfamily hydrolase